MNVHERLDWLRFATPEDIDQALEAGELDELLSHRGPGRVNDEQAALVVLIGCHFPQLSLDDRVCRWTELENGTAALLVDEAVLFATEGDALLVTGALEDGQVGCFKFTNDSHAQLVARTTDSFSLENLIAARASRN